MRKNILYHPRSFRAMLRATLFLALFIAIVACLAVPRYVNSASTKTATRNKVDTTKIQNRNSGPELPDPYTTRPSSTILNLLPTFFQSPSAITTYAGDCSTPKSVFNLQDTDLTVCAKVSGGQPAHHDLWSNTDLVLVAKTSSRA